MSKQIPNLKNRSPRRARYAEMTQRENSRLMALVIENQRWETVRTNGWRRALALEKVIRRS